MRQLYSAMVLLLKAILFLSHKSQPLLSLRLSLCEVENANH